MDEAAHVPGGTHFSYELPPVRVVFGAGSLGELPDVLGRAGLDRALVVTTPGRVAALRDTVAALDGRVAGVFDRAELHVPASVVNAALDEVVRLSPDSVVAVGGGSAIGVAKAMALAVGLPVVAVPTTYSGSEMTEIWGITEGGVKRTGRDARVAPRIVLYDPALTLSLPPGVSAASGMNAIAHAVEALYAPDANPRSTLLAEEAIRALARALPAIVGRPDDLDARAEALRGAHCAGSALGMTSMGLHHTLCHTLGGAFGLPHALTHAIVLPHVVRFNAPAAVDAARRVADALGTTDAAEGLVALNRSLGLTASLRDLGLTAADLDSAADRMAGRTFPNPRAVTREGVRAVLAAAA
jgi:maleylacetate reductase